MGKFDGMLICTDLDGTLLKKDKTISKENINAINYFKEQGGFFTIVTGRMPFFVFDICEIVQPNAPFGCINGGALYDYYKKEYIWKAVAHPDVIELVRCIDDNFSDVGIQVNTFENVFFCKENDTMEKFRKITGAQKLARMYDDINEPIAKILFGSESNEVIQKIKETLYSHPLAHKFDFIRSEKSLFEILPKGIGKGMSIQKLCEYMDIDVKKTITIGDYDNDISMFEVSEVGIAVSNACQEALDRADFVTVSNEEDAIAKVIYDLEKGNFFRR